MQYNSSVAPKEYLETYSTIPLFFSDITMQLLKDTKTNRVLLHDFHPGPRPFRAVLEHLEVSTYHNGVAS